MFWPLRGRVLKPRAKRRQQKVNAKSDRETFVFRQREVDVLRRAHKRSIGMTLSVNGRIRVSAPKSVSLARIELFLHENQDWIDNHLAKYQALRDAFPPKAYRDGEIFHLLGRSLALRYARGAGPRIQFAVSETELIASLPAATWGEFDPSAGYPELAGAIRGFYKLVGRRFLAARLQLHSDRMGLKPTAVRFRSQKTRWGSCSSSGLISLNWRLVFAPIDVIDYVIVHELAHLRHYNHSDAFWRLVSTQVPNYRELRNWLKKHQYDADFLAKRSELHP